MHKAIRHAVRANKINVLQCLCAAFPDYARRSAWVLAVRWCGWRRRRQRVASTTRTAGKRVGHRRHLFQLVQLPRLRIDNASSSRLVSFGFPLATLQPYLHSTPNLDHEWVDNNTRGDAYDPISANTSCVRRMVRCGLSSPQSERTRCDGKQ